MSVPDPTLVSEAVLLLRIPLPGSRYCCPRSSVAAAALGRRQPAGDVLRVAAGPLQGRGPAERDRAAGAQAAADKRYQAGVDCGSPGKAYCLPQGSSPAGGRGQAAAAGDRAESDNELPAATLTETAPLRATGAEIAVPLTPESVVMLPVTVKLFPAIEKLLDWNSSDWNEVPAVRSFCVAVSAVPWKTNWSPAWGPRRLPVGGVGPVVVAPAADPRVHGQQDLRLQGLDPQFAGFLLAGILAMDLERFCQGSNQRIVRTSSIKFVLTTHNLRTGDFRARRTKQHPNHVGFSLFQIVLTGLVRPCHRLHKQEDPLGADRPQQRTTARWDGRLNKTPTLTSMRDDPRTGTFCSARSCGQGRRQLPGHESRSGFPA